jgi:ferredoxin
MAKLVVDEDLCTGCGTCEDVCPEVFEIGDDDLAHLLPDVDYEEFDCVEEAIEACPVEAIYWED